MTTVNDGIRHITGGPQVNDGLSAYFGRTANESLNDAERRWLISQVGAVAGSINDLWFAFLRAEGFTGSLNDMMLAYWNTRYIRTFNGTTTFGTLQDPEILVAGDEIEIIFSSPSILPTASYLIDGDVTGVNRGYALIDSTTGKLVWGAGITAELNGVAINSNATTPVFGEVNTLKLTITSGLTFGTIGARFNAAQVLTGEILSVKFTDKSGTSDVVTNYVLDNDSLTTQYARGEASPSAKYITYSNFVAGDIEQFTYNQQTRCWEAAVHADICYQ